MPTIDDYLQQIRNAVYGRQVRSAIADGIETCYDYSANTIRYDITQHLSDEQKELARQNIGASENAVSITTQDTGITIFNTTT